MRTCPGNNHRPDGLLMEVCSPNGPAVTGQPGLLSRTITRWCAWRRRFGLRFFLIAVIYNMELQVP